MQSFRGPSKAFRSAFAQRLRWHSLHHAVRPMPHIAIAVFLFAGPAVRQQSGEWILRVCLLPRFGFLILSLLASFSRASAAYNESVTVFLTTGSSRCHYFNRRRGG